MADCLPLMEPMASGAQRSRLPLDCMYAAGTLPLMVHAERML